MVWDTKPRSHHPGSPLFGGRGVSSSGSNSFLRKLTSLTKRSRPRPVPGPRYAPASTSTSTSAPPSPEGMALAAARTASLKAAATTSITTNASTARPVSGSRTKDVIPAAAACSAPLVVQVEVRFPGLNGLPATPAYTHEYASSPDLVVTNRLCKGLLRRLIHCSTELITRKDSKALKQQRRSGQPASAKLLSYELHFRIIRKDAGVWAEKTFCSYQKQDMTSHDAHEVILATHRMVGLFLRRHDPSFHWTDLPPTETAAFVPRPEEPELVRHVVDHPLSLSCVPQSRFLDDAQSFEFVPGYAINLSFRSRCQGRKQFEWKRAINLQSKQSAPINLALAEDLLWQTFNSVNSALTTRRDAFLEEHKACDWLEGASSCQHFGEDALDIELGIENKLGPDYSHLNRTIRSKLGLFRHPDALDCQDFMQSIHSSLTHARDVADGRMSALPDFDLRILTLRGPNWSVDNPARFVLDASTSYSRRSTEAILDRVQTGIADVLRHKSCTIHIVAYKRGHLVLDKALVAHAPPAKPALFPKAPVEQQADAIVARLKERIHQDLDAVCKDTWSLDGVSEGPDECAAAAEMERARADPLPERSIPSSPTPDNFVDTVVVEAAAVAEEEPTIPAPRVVELPDDVVFDDLDPAPPSPTSTSSTRRRAFPLIPEKFSLPNSRSSSVGTRSSEEELAAAPTIDAEQESTPVPEELPPSTHVDEAIEADVLPIKQPELIVEPQQDLETVPVSQPALDFGTEPHQAEAAQEQVDSGFKLDSPPAFYRFDEVDDIPQVDLRFERQASPTVGTPLETILEYDSEPDEEFVELPSYDHGLPASPQLPAQTVPKVFEVAAQELPERDYSQPIAEPALEAAFESASELGPEPISEPHSRLESEDNEPIIPSSPWRDDHDEAFAADTTILTTGSSNVTRPSTPSLSLSSGEFNSPEFSLLDTPNISRETPARMVTCFDSDGEANFRRGYEADSESDTESHKFTRFIGGKKASSPSGAGEFSFVQPLTVSLPLKHSDLSGSESAPTEIWHEAADVSTDTETAGHFLKSEPEFDAAIPALSPGISFEDFAMTKPSLDLDEYAEVVADDEDVSVEVSKEASTEEDLPEIGTFSEGGYDNSEADCPLPDTENTEDASDLLSEPEQQADNAVEQGPIAAAEYSQEPTEFPESNVSEADEDPEPTLESEFEPEVACNTDCVSYDGPEFVPLPDSDDDGEVEEEPELMHQHHDEPAPAVTVAEEASELTTTQPLEPAPPSEPDISETLPGLGEIQDVQLEQEISDAQENHTSEESTDLVLELAELQPPAALDLTDEATEESEQQEQQQWLELTDPEVGLKAELQPEEEPEEPVEEPGPREETVTEQEPASVDAVFDIAKPEPNLAPDDTEILEPIAESMPATKDNDTFDEILTPDLEDDLGDAESSPIESTPSPDFEQVLDAEPTQASESIRDLDVHEQPICVQETQPVNTDSDLIPLAISELEQQLEEDVNDSSKDEPVEAEAVETQPPVNTNLNGASSEYDSEQVVEDTSESASPEPDDHHTCEAVSVPETRDLTIPLLHVPIEKNIAEQQTILELIPQAAKFLQENATPVVEAVTKSLVPDVVISTPAPFTKVTTESSALDDCDASCSEETTRDSIDTIEEFEDNDPPVDKRSTSWSLPTAGFLGLDETRLVKVGLRGALTGSHAFDNVAFEIRKRQQRHALKPADTKEADQFPPEVPADETSLGPSSADASSSAKKSAQRSGTKAGQRRSRSASEKAGLTLPKMPKQNRASSASSKGLATAPPSSAVIDPAAESPPANQDAVLPRVVMMFAGMAIMSQMINKSS